GMFALSGQPDRLQWFDLKAGTLTPLQLGWIDAAGRASMKWALSPDGASILLATFQDRPDEQTGNNGPGTDLWRAPSLGGEAEKLVRWPSRVYNLRFDAAGRGLYVVTDRGVAFNDVWHIPLDHPLERANKITFGQADEDWPSVSADGRWLV